MKILDINIWYIWFINYILAHEARWLYFYGPISTVLLINLLMFIHTTNALIQHMSNSKVLRGPESTSNVHHEK